MFYVCDRCGWAAQAGDAPKKCPECEHTPLSAFTDESEARATAELAVGFKVTMDILDRGGEV